MIISLGYRIKSIIATQFRRWATEKLKEFLQKGFALDDNRLKEMGGGNYWHELLDRMINANGDKILEGSGSVSHKQAVDKALEEYKKYQEQTLSPVEKAYLETIKSIEDKARKINRK